MRSCIVVLLALLISARASAQEQRRITFHVEGAPSQWLFLANYWGNKLFYTDSAFTDARGTAVFNRKEGYKAGMYAVLHGSNYAPFILNETDIELSTATADMKNRLTVQRSEENRLYLEHTRFLNIQNNVRGSLEAKATSDGNARAQLELIDKSISDHRQHFIAQHAGTMAAALVAMEMTPEAAPAGLDSAAAYTHLRTHFWDRVDLTNDNLARIPAFQNNLDEYFGRYVGSGPGPIIAAADELLGKMDNSPDLFRLSITRLLERVNDPEKPGNDAVFVHLVHTYHCPKNGTPTRAKWMAPQDLRNICGRADKAAPLVIGNKAHELILPDTTGKNWVKLSALKSDWVMLVFWSPHCGHCRSTLPQLHERYLKELKGLGVEVYAVAEAHDSTLTADWKKFVREHGLSWVNVGIHDEVYQAVRKDRSAFVPKLTNNESLNYQDAWAARSTPMFYLIDKERRIAAKRMTPDQVVDLVKKTQGK